MENNRFNQVPISQPPTKIPEDISKIKKRHWIVFFSVSVLVFELGFLYFCASLAADQILGNSWGLLMAIIPNIYVGIPVSIIGFCLVFLNYRNGQKTLALALLVFSTSMLPLIPMRIGTFFAPLFPGVKEHVEQEKKNVEIIKMGENFDNAKYNYIKNRYLELTKIFPEETSISKIDFARQLIKLSSGINVTLFYSAMYEDDPLWQEISKKTIKVALPNQYDFLGAYSDLNDLNWIDKDQQKIGLTCLIVWGKENDICFEKIPVLVYQNNNLVNEMGQGENINKKYLIKYEVK